MGFGVVVERHHAVPIALEQRRGVGVLPSKAFGELIAWPYSIRHHQRALGANGNPPVSDGRVPMIGPGLSSSKPWIVQAVIRHSTERAPRRGHLDHHHSFGGKMVVWSTPMRLVIVDDVDPGLALYLARLHAAGLSPAGCWSARRKPIRKAGAPCCISGRCFAACEGAAASKAIQGAGCRSTPSAESSAAALPLPASRAGYPVTVSGLGGRNRWPPAGPRLSRCRRRAGGSHRRCRATMHGASWQHGAPSLASATLADKAGVDYTTIFPPKGGRSGGE